ncbi:MAG TPA: outer membrane protein assembly factor BamE [Spongiibacteraceae bacterium]|nr:outer membrane protein assembly factor BamE [Spongiibacteraceae bacterium]
MSYRLKSLFFAPLLLTLLAGCSTFEFPWVYKLSIDQGNVITQEMVNKLEPGMTRSQVQFVMGSPLIADPFHENRWDYIYTLLDPKGKRTEQRLTVFFTDDKLSSLNGNVVPQQVEAAAPEVAPAAPATN